MLLLLLLLFSEECVGVWGREEQGERGVLLGRGGGGGALSLSPTKANASKNAPLSLSPGRRTLSPTLPRERDALVLSLHSHNTHRSIDLFKRVLRRACQQQCICTSCLQWLGGRGGLFALPLAAAAAVCFGVDRRAGIGVGIGVGGIGRAALNQQRPGAATGPRGGSKGSSRGSNSSSNSISININNNNPGRRAPRAADARGAAAAAAATEAAAATATTPTARPAAASRARCTSPPPQTTPC